ncbi:MAG: hypothetical protein NUW37_19030 [Planctomycetes bacterium]|nr:hypothetical protein [Planctomycetota bacterium]
MTSINAIRFNEHQGAIATDEEMTIQSEVKLPVSDKVRNVIPDSIIEQYGLVASVSTTGSAPFGVQLTDTVRRRIRDDHDSFILRTGKPPAISKSVEDVAELAFEVAAEMRKDYIDEVLLTRYGFSRKDYIKGFYSGKDGRVDIKDKTVLESANQMIVGKSEYTRHFSRNHGFIAGWSSVDNFRMYYFSLATLLLEPIGTFFQASGSGLDSADIVFGEYARHLPLDQRRGDIDPVDGLFTLIKALNMASRMSFGCGGYPNITIFDGKQKENSKKRKEIADHRAKFASEIVYAAEEQLITRSLASECIEDTLVKDKPFHESEQKILSKTKNLRALSRLLRGYKRSDGISLADRRRK